MQAREGGCVKGSGECQGRAFCCQKRYTVLSGFCSNTFQNESKVTFAAQGYLTCTKTICPPPGFLLSQRYAITKCKTGVSAWKSARQTQAKRSYKKAWEFDSSLMWPLGMAIILICSFSSWPWGLPSSAPRRTKHFEQEEAKQQPAGPRGLTVSSAG